MGSEYEPDHEFDHDDYNYDDFDSDNDNTSRLPKMSLKPNPQGSAPSKPERVYYCLPDRPSEIPYKVIPANRRLGLPSWTKYAHPPCFDYTNIKNITEFDYGSPYFANCIEIYRPVEEYSIVPPPERRTIGYDLPRQAPTMPYYRYNPDCIGWSIAKRMPSDKPWCPLASGIAWLLLDQCATAYGVNINFEFATSAGWTWVRAHEQFGKSWAAIAWDYVAEASDWKTDRLTLQPNPDAFEKKPDMKLLENIKKEALYVSNACVKDHLIRAGKIAAPIGWRDKLKPNIEDCSSPEKIELEEISDKDLSTDYDEEATDSDLDIPPWSNKVVRSEKLNSNHRTQRQLVKIEKSYTEHAMGKEARIRGPVPKPILAGTKRKMTANKNVRWINS
jgi:hypothetical protein